ncbi:MAG TPA: hypothetical protein VNO30_29930 [Kofleriaceae bacterium]|nr:hypothetical protein [Kofleriaceae bacterium]
MKTFGLALSLLLGFGGLVFGGLAFSGSDNAVHEIEALIMLLIGTVGIGCSTVAQTLESVRAEVEVQTKMTAGAAQRKADVSPPS